MEAKEFITKGNFTRSVVIAVSVDLGKFSQQQRENVRNACHEMCESLFVEFGWTSRKLENIQIISNMTKKGRCRFEFTFYEPINTVEIQFKHETLIEIIKACLYYVKQLYTLDETSKGLEQELATKIRSYNSILELPFPLSYIKDVQNTLLRRCKSLALKRC